MNAGYPGPHSWLVGRLAGEDSVGASCNADASLPFDYEVELQIVVPDSADADVIAGVAGGLMHNEPIRPLPDDGVITFRGSGDQYVSFQVELLVDADGDERCGPGDRTYLATAADPEVDLHTFEVRGTTSISAAGDDDPCRWSPVESM